MRRYLEVYWIMFRNSLIREMNFKVNFLLWMIVEILWFAGQIVFIDVLYLYVNRIGDWTKWEVVLLVGTHQIIGQLFQAIFYMNVANVPELVRTGKLDFFLLLPLDSQFAVSTTTRERHSRSPRAGWVPKTRLPAAGATTVFRKILKGRRPRVSDSAWVW